jgi:hypothetical protein
MEASLTPGAVPVQLNATALAAHLHDDLTQVGSFFLAEHPAVHIVAVHPAILLDQRFLLAEHIVGDDRTRDHRMPVHDVAQLHVDGTCIVGQRNAVLLELDVCRHRRPSIFCERVA